MADKTKKGGGPAAGGQDANIVAFGDAARALKRQRGRNDPAPAQSRGGAPPGKWTPNDVGLPTEDACPVEPVGIEGELYHVIDSARQFRSLTAADFSHSGIQSLFAATPNYPQWMAPRYGRAPAPKEDGEKPKPPPIKSFEDDRVRELLFLACNRKGLFSPTDKLRGRGAWRLRGGGLVYHAGEELWTVEDTGGMRFRELETGMHEGYLYPRLAPLPAPWTQPIGAAELERSVGALVNTFRKWNFERPDVDPILLLGWIGVAYLGGALDWRSAILLVGDKGTGKSTLQDSLKALFGDALFHSADTTAAGVYQKMAHDARPVAVDELEAGADMRKVNAVVALMRAASSGAFARRGGQDHNAVEFQMRSAFLFSSINNPLQSSQDLSRVAILRLQALRHDQAMPPPIDADITGRVVLARLMSEWPRFGDLYDVYAGALAAGGHEPRGQRTYGTLLACAEMLLGPELGAALGVPLSEDPAYWTEHLAADRLPEVEDAEANWRSCITWLMTAQVQPWRNGARNSIGQCLDDLVRDEAKGVDGGDYTLAMARRDLALTGLGLIAPGEISALADYGYLLAVPNKGQLIAKLYEGTQWAGSPGGGGPWKDALRQAPQDPEGRPIVIGDKAYNRVRIGGVQQRCSLVVLRHFHAAPER